MNEFKRKNKHNFWHSPLAIIVLFCLLIFSGYKVVGLIQKDKETTRKKELILKEIESLRKREESLSQDIAKFKTEEGIEGTIRDKYQVVKPGEKMVIIVDEEEILSEDDSPTENSFWEWVRNLFKK
jgi:cell division protein FtsB